MQVTLGSPYRVQDTPLLLKDVVAVENETRSSGMVGVWHLPGGASVSTKLCCLRRGKKNQR